MRARSSRSPEGARAQREGARSRARSARRFSYAAYGLGIDSAIELPELVPGRGARDVAIRIDRIGSVPEPVAGPDGLRHATTAEAYFQWTDTATIVVRGGREIVVDPAPAVDLRALGPYLLGPAFGVLLHQRGLLTLHGSAIALNGGAIAFLGAPGWGKSTTAAAFQARGHALVADDVVAVDSTSADGSLVLPAFPQLKLWPDVVAWLGEDAESLPRVHAMAEKRARVATKFERGALPLRRLYVLADADRLALEPIEGHGAVFELVQHSYIAPVLRLLGSAAHLAQCARLATTLVVRRLCRPRSLAGLDALAALVEADGA